MKLNFPFFGIKKWVTIIGVSQFLRCAQFKKTHKFTWILLIILESLETFFVKYKMLPRVNYIQHKVNFKNSSLPSAQKVTSVQIVNYEGAFGKSGILTKISQNLNSAINNMNVKSNLVEIPNLDSLNCSAIYHIYFRFCLPIPKVKNYAMVTHIDSRMKMAHVLWLLHHGVNLICLSAETAQAIRSKSGYDKNIFFVNPSPAESMGRRKLKIGFFSNIYIDGRKRESVILSSLQGVPIDDIEFFIMGTATEDFIGKIASLGITVQYLNHFDRDFYISALSQIDVTLYAGLDDGAVSVLDSIISGVPVIISRSGYHLDIPPSPSVSFFQTSEELHNLLSQKLHVFQQLRGLLKIKSSGDFALETISIMNGIKVDNK